MSETVSPKNLNVTDYYQNFSDVLSIKSDLDARRTPMVSVCMNLTNDFNKATVVRNSNGFLGSAVIMAGRKKYDKRGTVGTHHYEHVEHAEDVAPVIARYREDGYTIFAVDNNDDYTPVSLWETTFPEKSVFIYGEEMLGLSDDVIALCDHMVYIPMFGSVRSLNVGTASGIVMNEYSRQNAHLFAR